MVNWPPAVALKTSRWRVGTDRRPLASKLNEDAPWNTRFSIPDENNCNAGIFPTKLHFFALYQEITDSQEGFRVFFNEIKGLEQGLQEKLTEKILEN